MKTIEPWKTLYPTVGAVMESSFATLCAWHENLPPPQTDVEHTVRRRITSQMESMGLEEIRKVEPVIAEKFEKIGDEFEKIFGYRPGPMFGKGSK